MLFIELFSIYHKLVVMHEVTQRTWVNGHDDDHVDEIEHVLNGIGGSGHVERNAHLTPEVLHLRQRLHARAVEQGRMRVRRRGDGG